MINTPAIISIIPIMAGSNHIQRIIGEEQFQHFISALW